MNHQEAMIRSVASKLIVEYQTVENFKLDKAISILERCVGSHLLTTILKEHTNEVLSVMATMKVSED